MAWRRLIAAALVTVVAAGGWLAFRGDTGLFVVPGEDTVEGVDEAPEIVVTSPELAGDRWLCPRPFPVKAYDSGEFFPAEHPGHPPLTVRPEACYRDPDRARAAGFDLAPPPAGVDVAGGLYLVPVVTPAPDVCRDLGAEVGFTVPCPSRLPWPANGSSCASGTCIYQDGVVIEQRGFPVPDGWCTGCDGHVVIVAMPADRHPPEAVACGTAGPGVPHSGSELVFRDCPPGDPWLPRISGNPHEGHTLTGWRSDVAVYVVSVDGHGAPQREFLTALVSGLDGDPPAR